MGLFDNLVKVKIGENYLTDDGIRELLAKAHTSAAIGLCDIPQSIFHHIRPALKGKKVKVSMPDNRDPQSYAQIQADHDIHITPTRLVAHVQKSGDPIHQVIVGEVYLDKHTFDITWNEPDNIFDISAATIRRCQPCVPKTKRRSAGVYKHLHIGTIIEPPELGIERIKEDLIRYDQVILNNVPPSLILELAPHLKHKNYKIVVNDFKKIPKKARALKQMRSVPKVIKTFMRYQGMDVEPGGIGFPDIHYCLAWKNDRILNIRTIEWDQCVGCMNKAHNMIYTMGKGVRW